MSIQPACRLKRAASVPWLEIRGEDGSPILAMDNLFSPEDTKGITLSEEVEAPPETNDIDISVICKEDKFEVGEKCLIL